MRAFRLRALLRGRSGARDSLRALWRGSYFCRHVRRRSGARIDQEQHIATLHRDALKPNGKGVRGKRKRVSVLNACPLPARVPPHMTCNSWQISVCDVPALSKVAKEHNITLCKLDSLSVCVCMPFLTIPTIALFVCRIACEPRPNRRAQKRTPTLSSQSGACVRGYLHLTCD